MSSVETTENSKAYAMAGDTKMGSNHRASSGFWIGMHPLMATMATATVVLFVLFTIANAEYANDLYSSMKGWIESNLSWYYVLVVSVVFLFALWLMLSRFGDLKLGTADQEPEFSRFAWFSMLFSAAVGIGLLFWSIAEPIFHFQGNPYLDMHGIAAESQEAAQVAIRITLLHWGLHGWGIYAMTGLCLAYFSYRKGLPLTIRSALYPLLGERIYGPAGHAIDLLAVFGTVFGVATTLGLGVAQMNAGFNYLFGVEISTVNQIIIIAVVMLVSTASTVSGVEKGMRLISVWNVRLTVLMLAFFLLAGPTVYLLGFYITSIGDYLTHFIAMGFWVDPDSNDKWQGAWTLFYWSWTISWGPFVGMFIARISRGRTIREYLLGAMVLPTALAFLWLCIFGGTALHMEVFGEGGLKEVVNQDMTAALYRTIELLNVEWATWLIAALATFLLLTWFITSADSGTLVVCTILSMGDRHPRRRFRIFWGASEGFVAAALLLAGGLAALQNISIIIALPFSVILLLMVASLALSLYRDEPKLSVESLTAK